MFWELDLESRTILLQFLIKEAVQQAQSYRTAQTLCYIKAMLFLSVLAGRKNFNFEIERFQGKGQTFHPHLILVTQHALVNKIKYKM